MKHFSDLSSTADRLVDVAEGLIQQYGYNGFSYDDIAREVGIKKPSIHHHFPTKGELVAVVAQRYTHRFRTRLLDIEGMFSSAASRLTAYAKLFADTYRCDRRLCVCGMLGSEANALPPEAASAVARFFELNIEWLAAVLQDGQQQNELRLVGSPAAHARAYLAALEGSMVVGRGLAQDDQPSEIGQLILKSWLA